MTQELTQEEYDIVIEDARYGDLETLQEIFGELPASLLLEIKGTDTEVTPIHMASANGHLTTVEYLLSILPLADAKALVAAQNVEGNTALHWAALNGHISIVELLCEKYDADAFVKNKFDHDAIYEAENNGKEDIETYFLKKFDVEPLEEKDGEISVKVTNDQVAVKPGQEIEKISEEQVKQIESNEKFLEERTKQNLDV